MTQRSHPIITSLLDYDAYKTSMAQLIWRRYLNIPAIFALNNRTPGVNLLDYIDIHALRAEVEHARSLRLQEDELAFLQNVGKFDPTFIAYLRDLRLPEVQIVVKDRVLNITTEGLWAVTTFWETIILAIVNELYARGWRRQMGLGENAVLAEGRRRLDAKIEILKSNPGIKIIEFGTRRRYSTAWQREVVQRLMQTVPHQLIGVSNVHNAFELGLNPVGTYAHEMPMAYTAINNDLKMGEATGHRQMLKDWWEEFGFERSIALTDTFGSDFFFQDFRDMAADWKGLRQDSGNPFEFGKRAIAFYEELGIDPMKKLIVFSDGLDIDLIVNLYRHFEGRMQMAFGWGTNLTNDVGIPPLSLVMKLTQADGRGTVKLSDNLAKAMGAPADIRAAKWLFHHTNTYRQTLTV